MSNWINIETQQPPPYVYNNTQNFPANESAMLAAGWRLKDEASIPSLHQGYTRTSIRWVQDGGRPTRAIAQVTDRLTSEIEAEQAASVEAEKDARAALDNGDVIVRAVAAEIVQEVETVKAAIRTLHPAAASALPAKSYSDWVNAIRSRARGIIG